MAQRLPIPGSDNGTWGSILNGFLEVSHNADGSLQTTALTTAGAVTSVNNSTPTNGNVTLTASSLGAAPLASPSFTGTPTAPTATAGTNTTQLATTAFTTTAIGGLSGVYESIRTFPVTTAAITSVGLAAAIQAQINLAVANGYGKVTLPPGLLTPNAHDTATGPAALGSIPAGITGFLIIEGNGTCLQLTSTYTIAFQWNQGSPPSGGSAGATIQNVELRDFDVDANNVGGKTGEVIVGPSLTGSSTPAYGINYNCIRVRRIKAINVPVGTDSSVTRRTGVGIWSSNNGTTPDPVATIQDIIIEDVDVEGGLVGYDISGRPYGVGITTSTIFVDRVYVIRGSHLPATVPAAAWPSGGGNHILIGNRATGNRCSVSGFRGINCTDTGIEIDGMLSVDVVDCEVIDSWNHCFYGTNYVAPTSFTEQITHYRSCKAGRQNITVSNNVPGHGYSHGTKQGSNYSPNVSAISCSYVNDTQTNPPYEAIDFNGPQSVTIEDFKLVSNLGTYSASTSFLGNGVRIGSLDSSQTTVASINGFKASITGVKTGTGTVQYIPLTLGQVGITFFSCIRPSITGSITSGNITGIVVGDGGAIPTVGGTIKDFYMSESGGSTAVGIQIEPSTNTTISPSLTIEDPDFTHCQSSVVEVNFVSGDTTQPTKTTIIRPRWRTAKAPSLITVGSSPFTYRNADGYTERIITSGGTVSEIEYSLDNTTFTNVGVTAGILEVEPGAVIRVTYSVAPTMTKVPPNALAAS